MTLLSSLLAAGNQQFQATLPATNLVAHFKSDAGITESGGRVSAWADQSGNGNDATQSSASSQPYYRTSRFNGRPSVQFLGNALGMPFAAAKTWDARSLSFFLCGRVYGAGGWQMIAVANYVNPQGHLRIGSTWKQETSSATNLRGMMTPTVYGMTSGSTSAAFQNTASQTGIGAMPADTDCLGAYIGASSNGSGNAEMEVWEIACYDAALSPTVAQQVVDYFVAKYGLRSTAFPRTILCVGDSITFGVNLTTLGAFPFQIVEIAPVLASAFEINAQSIPGAALSALISAGTTTDSRLVSGSTNYLHVLIGRNDVTEGGASAASVYANLVSYVQARVAAGWNVVVGTCIATPEPYWSMLVDYNDLIRGTVGGGVGPGIVADAGATAVIDYAALPEFDDTADRLNLTYFQGDGTHPTDTGYSVMAQATAAYFTSVL